MRRPSVSYAQRTGYAAPETSTTFPSASYAVVVTQPSAFVSATQLPPLS